MQISYRTARWILGAGLLSLSHAGTAQTAPTPDDSIKGRLWTATAGRIWADTKPKPKQPAPWPTVQAFEKWLVANPTDKSELGLLHADVIKNFGAGTKATPTQVAEAIIGQINQRQQSGQGRLTRVKVPLLGDDLAPLTQARAGAETAPAATAPTPSSGAKSTVITAVQGANGLAVLSADTARPAPPQAAIIDSGFTATPVEQRYFGLPANLAGLVLLALGTLLGVGLSKALRPSGRHRHRHHDHPTPSEPHASAIMNSSEYRKLQAQNRTLNTQLHRLQQQLAELQAQVTGKPVAAPKAAGTGKKPVATTPPAAPVAAPLAPVEMPSIEELVGAPAEVAAPAATRYGPVQETPFLEERKIVDAPLPQLALMLTVDSRDPSQATFTLNPQVDQVRLIGDGLTRLQKFFDYDPPLGGRISAVAAVRPGRLQRQDSGWQVVERARLAIS